MHFGPLRGPLPELEELPDTKPPRKTTKNAESRDDVLHGLRIARGLIADELKAIRAAHPRGNDPFTRGARDALNALDDKLKNTIKQRQPVANLPRLLRG